VLPQVHSSEGNSQGSRESEGGNTASATVSGEPIGLSDRTGSDRHETIGGAKENAPQSANTDTEIEQGAADKLAKVDEAVGST